MALDLENEDHLYNLAYECESLFHGLPDGVAIGQLCTEFQQRFAIWTAHLGVFARRSQCLDTRLRNPPDLQDLVVRLLDILRRNLQYLSVDSGNSVEEDVNSGAALKAIDDVLHRLNRLGVTIRRSGWAKVDSKAEASAANLDLRRFPTLCAEAVESLYPGAHDSLKACLSQTMIDRYKRMLYLSSRNNKLKTRREIPQELEPIPELSSDESKAVASSPRPIKAAVGPSTGKPSTGLSQAGLSSVDTQIIRNRARPADEASTRIHKTSSCQVNLGNYPRPPASGFATDSFACEWCSEPLLKKDLSGSDWRRHVDRDLEPYICLSEKCAEKPPTFSAFENWFSHMSCHSHRWHERVYLRPSWFCSICVLNRNTYESPQRLLTHLKESHGDNFTDEQLQLISRQSKTMHARATDDCVLCCSAVNHKDNQVTTDVSKRNRPTSTDDGSKSARTAPEMTNPVPHAEDVESSDSDSEADISRQHTSMKSNTHFKQMARHISTHLQLLMFLTLRFAALQQDNEEGDDEIRSDSVDIDDGDGAADGDDLGKLSDIASDPDMTMKSGKDEDSDEDWVKPGYNIERGDDEQVPNAEVDFEHIPRQYDDLDLEDDSFLRGVIESGAYQSWRHEPQDTLLLHDRERPASVDNSISRDRYTIAWICTLPIELAAAQAVLENLHVALPLYFDDNNTYILGSIQNHNIVITCLPGFRATDRIAMLRSLIQLFPYISHGLIVGIGGAAPSRADIRLGDIVVGTRLTQWDFGRISSNDRPQAKHKAIPISAQSFLNPVAILRATHEVRSSRVPAILQETMKENARHHRPDIPDRLFQASYEHDSSVSNCGQCDQSQLIERKPRESPHPTIHYGGIACGNGLIKNAVFRDEVARELDVICFDMETAGTGEVLPCLVIRGICDYSDSHKSTAWQGYAAATSAAYAREFLEFLSSDIKENEGGQFNTLPRRPISTDQGGKLLESLKFQHIDSRKSKTKAAYNNTCQWILRHPDYLNWLDPDKVLEHHGLLWIWGEPGTGKSTMMNFMYQQMREEDKPGQALTALFLFNAEGSDLDRSASGLYRSLLAQLLECFDDIQRVLGDSDLVARDQIDCPSLSLLKDLFHAATSSLGSRSFTCFIDALDECDMQQVTDMIRFFEELAEFCAKNCLKFRICFSSRPNSYLHFIKSGIRFILEIQDGHVGDLETYINRHLRVGNVLQVEELKQTMVEKAACSFRWVALMVDTLNKEFSQGRLGLRTRLINILIALSDVFRDILRSDTKDMKDLLISTLWVLFARRPLTPAEYYHAFWSGLSLEGMADPEMPDANPSDATECFTRCVISSSRGLAKVTEAICPTVQFTHESIREFLINDNNTHILRPEIGADWVGSSHERLKLCCNSYLFHLFQRGVPVGNYTSGKTTGVFDSMASRYPFLVYSSQCVLYHANAAADAVSQQQFLNNFPLLSWIRIFNMFEKHEIGRYSPHADILYILADMGLSALIRTRLKSHPNIDITGERYRYPLIAAMAKGHGDSVIALLGLDSNVCDGIDITDGLKPSQNTLVLSSETPLSWACENDYYGVAKVLFRRCVANAEEFDRGEIESLLSIACQRGDEKLAYFSLNKGISPDSFCRFPSMSRPLTIASTFGHIDVARLLLEKGANIAVSDMSGDTSLFLAVANGHEAVVELLIDWRADIESRDANGQTPLSRAAQLGKKAVVKHLLSRGADIESRDAKDGTTPLSWAARLGRRAIVELLLGSGAKIDSRDVNGTTPLSWAIAYGHADVVRLLQGLMERQAVK